MDNRFELYKAVKYEVDNFKSDHGMDLLEMWKVVNFEALDPRGNFTPSWNIWWKETCLEDYRLGICI